MNQNELNDRLKIFFYPQTISHYHETLGEALQGVELEFSGLQIEFKCKKAFNVVKFSTD